MNQQPYQQLPEYKLTFVEGPMGSGKSTYAVARVKDAHKKDPSIRIFANFHLYGIRYVYMPLAKLFEYINTDLIRNGYLIIDEGYISADARTCTSASNRLASWFIQQGRKRGLHLIFCAQHSRFIDWRIRYTTTEHVLCSYNQKTQYVSLSIRSVGNRKRDLSFWAPQYWKYFDTEEQFYLPDKQIAKVIAELQVSSEVAKV